MVCGLVRARSAGPVTHWPSGSYDPKLSAARTGNVVTAGTSYTSGTSRSSPHDKRTVSYRPGNHASAARMLLHTALFTIRHTGKALIWAARHGTMGHWNFEIRKR